MGKGYRTFRSRLFESKSLEMRLLSGSLYERPLYYILTDITDVDDLIWKTNICALPTGKIGLVPSKFRPGVKILTVSTERVQAGYAKLLTGDRGNNYYRRTEVHEYYSSETGSFQSTPKGPAVKKYIKWLPNKVVGCPHDDLCLFYPGWKQIKQMKIDLVEAVYCPYWPPEVAEWATRKRFNGWPTDDVVNRIVEFGCHFVAKPHPKTPNDSTQWRFSFSNAELILIHGLNDVQKYIYHILRLIKKEVVKSCGGEDSTILCTYFFKTLMLWACEEKSREFWAEENLENSIGELILQLIEWLIERRIPNYFIPSYNMIDYLNDNVNLSKEMAFFLYHREHFTSKMLIQTPKAFPKMMLSISFPNNLLHYVMLHLNFGNLVNPLEPNSMKRFSQHLTNSEQFLPEMRNLYLGISYQNRLMKLQDKSAIREVISTLSSFALTHFDKAIHAEHNGATNFVVSLSESLLQFVNQLTSIEKRSTHEKDISEQNYVSNFTHRDLKIPLLHIAVERMLQNVDNILPPPLYFVAAAYKANFLYVSLRDHRGAVKQCEKTEEWLQKFERSEHDESMVRHLPCVVTNEHAAIFDDDIQTVFGFVTLCNRISAGNGSVSRDSLVLRLPATDFLKYINYQCLRHLGVEPFKDPFTAPFNFARIKQHSVKFARLFLSTAIVFREYSLHV